MLFMLAFFPQLIAGPIIKFNDMIHQIKSQKIVKKNIFYHKAFIGIIILSIGLVKKVIFADTLSEFVDPVFFDIKAGQDNVSMITAWFAVLCFHFKYILIFLVIVTWQWVWL